MDFISESTMKAFLVFVGNNFLLNKNLPWEISAIVYWMSQQARREEIPDQSLDVL